MWVQKCTKFFNQSSTATWLGIILSQLKLVLIKTQITQVYYMCAINLLPSLSLFKIEVLGSNPIIPSFLLLYFAAQIHVLSRWVDSWAAIVMH